MSKVSLAFGSAIMVAFCSRAEAYAGVGGCPPSDNDCCVASPDDSPGCVDVTCCEAICAGDGFCCDVIWDFVCADEAVANSDAGGPCVCGPGDPGSCFEPNQTPGCNDPVCEECVCALDPFCCDIAYDEDCVFIAETDCAEECGAVGAIPTVSEWGMIALAALLLAVGMRQSIRRPRQASAS